ncbi:hypothetical protein GRF59_14950 [Paenibacillus sp. HJL G12]|uniref:Uncharacterized protein n=1 Tax=Paenibacillus dendrobii TaxID=2691084 RepID=A0A7X3LIT4_9BACL|nr:hypothetical protein [Paenibacillus dendrobii]MWV44918.1 hypothetical protein [Paenibacillus dendrobii]
MRIYYAETKALGDTKYHIVTANNEIHAKKLIDDFWFNDKETEIIDIVEVSYHGVQMTKHESA